jgi:hypothetical protein
MSFFLREQLISRFASHGQDNGICLDLLELISAPQQTLLLFRSPRARFEYQP